MVDDWFAIKVNEAEGLCDDEEKRVHIQVCYKPAGVSYKNYYNNTFNIMYKSMN